MWGGHWSLTELGFRAGELHNHVPCWEEIACVNPSEKHEDILTWIRDRVSILPFFRPFKGSFKGKDYDSDRLPSMAFRKNVSCKSFVPFIQRTLIDRLKMGAISLVGSVGLVKPPYLVLPLTVEPSKLHLSHDAQFLNLWMQDRSFTLDGVTDLPP